MDVVLDADVAAVVSVNDTAACVQEHDSDYVSVQDHVHDWLR